jgi:ribonuclease HII
VPVRRSPRWSRIERDARDTFGALIAGIDEVGRGPLAGPVVACAIIMPADQRAIAGVDDSKRLPPAERERLCAAIRARAVAIGVGAASPREVDHLNIYRATTLAMQRAIRRLGCIPHHVIVDGKPIRTLGVEHTAVVGGDGKCYAVACASIVAKVTRDRLMQRLAARYPGYDWAQNAGYGTPRHLEALDRLGTTPHHRRSFCVKQLTLALVESAATDAPAGTPSSRTAADSAPCPDVSRATPDPAVSGAPVPFPG